VHGMTGFARRQLAVLLIESRSGRVLLRIPI
jgi:hypothetical protein